MIEMMIKCCCWHLTRIKHSSVSNSGNKEWMNNKLISLKQRYYELLIAENAQKYSYGDLMVTTITSNLADSTWWLAALTFVYSLLKQTNYLVCSQNTLQNTLNSHVWVLFTPPHRLCSFICWNSCQFRHR